MSRTLPAMLALALAACSSGGSSSTSNNSGTPGPTGTANSASTGASSATGTGGTTGAASTGGGSTSGGGLTAESYNQMFNSAYCNAVLRCESAAPYILTLCDQLELLDLSDLPLAVDAGRIAFDPASAAACVAALPNVRDCESVLEQGLPAPCNQAIVGQVPGNQPCYGSADCQSRACSGNTPLTCSAGTCTGVVGVGASCDCMDCGVCDSSKGLTCFNQICAAPAQLGGACGGGMVPCDTGLDCINGACATIPVGPGDACAVGDGDCAAGSYCFGVGAASGGNCATKVALGQPCGQDADHQRNAFSLADNQCAGRDVVCLGAGTLMDGGVEGGTCAKLSDITGGCSPPGSQINQSDDYNEGCYVGLNCITGACVRPPSSGPCSTFSQPCDLTQSFCDSAASDDCLPYVAPGGSCDQSNSDECGLTGTCTVNDICQSQNPSCSPTL